MFFKEYTTTLPARIFKREELAPCEDAATMQVFLDVFANSNGYTCCTEKEALNLLKEKEEGKEENVNVKNKTPSFTSSFPEIANPLVDPDVNAFVEEDENDDEEIASDGDYYEDFIDFDKNDKEDNEEESYPDSTEDVTDTAPQNTDEKKGPKLPKVEKEQNQSFDLANKYFEAKELETGRLLQGYLASSKDGLYIIRGNINVGKEIQQGNITAYNANIVVCKVDPSTVRIVDKDK